MQDTQRFHLDTFSGVTLDRISEIIFPLSLGDRIFLIGDLGSGKSTLVRSILQHSLSDTSLIIRSPTYTYYEKYGNNIYHFDLYRLSTPDDLLSIGALDILEDPHSICLIEWPEILPDRFHPTKIIRIVDTLDGGRSYTIETRLP